MLMKGGGPQEQCPTRSSNHLVCPSLYAMVFFLLVRIAQNPQQTYMQMLISVRYVHRIISIYYDISFFSREILRSKYSQKPQLSSSHPIDTDILFIA